MQRYKLVILLYIVFRYNNRKNHIAVSIRLGYLGSCFLFFSPPALRSLSLSFLLSKFNPVKIDLLSCVSQSVIRYLNRVTSTSVDPWYSVNIIGSSGESFRFPQAWKKRRVYSGSIERSTYLAAETFLHKKHVNIWRAIFFALFKLWTIVLNYI